MSLFKQFRAVAAATVSLAAFATAVPALANEYAAWHAQIGNSAAIGQTARFGYGVRLAVLDTGTNINHVDLRGRVLTGLSGSTAGGNWRNDRDGHGTTVASAALANRNGTGIVGVAPRASLISLQISTDGGASSDAINRALRMAVNRGAKVINLSFGYNGWSTNALYEWGLHQAMQYAARRAVIVVSAGNDGNYKPDDTAMHLLMRGVAGAGIMAGSVDRNNSDSSFSNAPGTWSWHGNRARDYFLNAPGEDIRLATNTGGYEVTSGTSFSAPIIAGAAALVRAKHPHLTPQQTVAILLNSARDLGAAGTDTLYGRGLLQVNRALQAAGQQRVALGQRVGGPSQLLTGTAIAGGAAMGSLGDIRAALSGAVIFDDYGRDFAANLDGRIVARGARTDILDRLLGESDERIVAAEMGNMLLLVSADGQNDVALDHTGRRRHMLSDTGAGPQDSLPNGFALAWSHGATEATIGHGSRFAEHGNGPFLTSGAGAGGPVFALAHGGAFGRLTHELGGGLSLGARFSEAEPELAMMNLSGTARAVSIEAGYAPTEAVRFDLAPSFLTERTAVLGSLSSGATSLGDSAETLAITATATVKLDGGLTLRGHLTEGMTTVSAAGGSLFRSVDALHSRAYGASLEKAGLFSGDDSFGLSVSRPLRVHSGNASLDVPTGRTLGGEVVYRHADVSMAPDGTQTDIELTYAKPLAAGITSNLHLMLQDDAGHRDGAVEAGALARIKFEF
ncbi:S8 family peptidase [Novispirillum sp. DQ9]|uniref:S8 family peptidase n=1 Tax=Novispirillum sp. DQ9 TaxID=3398612 RepID=UPI003C7DFF3D